MNFQYDWTFKQVPNSHMPQPQPGTTLPIIARRLSQPRSSQLPGITRSPPYTTWPIATFRYCATAKRAAASISTTTQPSSNLIWRRVGVSREIGVRCPGLAQAVGNILGKQNIPRLLGDQSAAGATSLWWGVSNDRMSLHHAQQRSDRITTCPAAIHRSIHRSLHIPRTGLYPSRSIFLP